MNFTEDHQKVLKAATLYYKQSLTQSEIGKRLGVSRPVVSKMLQIAREQGIVTIEINDENAQTAELAVALEEKYGLKEVVIISNSSRSTPEQMKHKVAIQAASVLQRYLTGVHSIGLSWGTTLADVIECMPYVKVSKIAVAPLVGGVYSQHVYFDANHLTSQLAEKLGGMCSYFYAPALAESVEIATILNQTEMVKRAKKAAKQVDFALIGVGNPNTSSTWRTLGYLNEQGLADLTYSSKIVGDAVASLFDKNGQTVDNEITKRMMGLSVEEIKAIPTVMIVASGQDKASSIQPLLISGTCQVLVCDQRIGTELLHFE